MLLLQTSGITSNRVLVDATGSTTIQVAWWTEDALVVAWYTVSCHVFPAENLTNVASHTQNVTVFTDQSINSAIVHQLIPTTRYRCCLAEHYVNNTLNSTAEVCKQAITLRPTTQVDGPAMQGSTNSPAGATVSLFVMMLLALLCTSLLLIVFMKQGRDREKIAGW